MAEKLGKFPHEVRALPSSEFEEILEWFDYQGQEHKKARKQAEREAKRSNRKPPKPTKMGSKKK